MTRSEEVRRQSGAQAMPGFEALEAEDIADAITFIVTRPRRIAINEVLIRPSGQQA